MHVRRGIAIGAVLVTGASLLALPARAAGCASGAVHVAGRWAEIDLPHFPAVSFSRAFRPLATYAVDQGRAGRLFVTDGDTVFRSADGGCTWKQVYQVAVRALSTESVQTVQAILAPGGDRVYLILVTGSGQDGRYELLASTNGGETYAATGTLPPQAALTDGRFATSVKDPKRLYVSVGSLLWVSKDAGATWTQSSALAAIFPSSTDVLLAADPANADVVYAYVAAAAGLARSTDGGTTFRKVSDTMTVKAAGALAIVHQPGAPEVLLSDGTTMYGCNADCSKYGAVPGPASVTVVVAGSNTSAVVYGGKPAVSLWSYNPRSGAATALPNPWGQGPDPATIRTDRAARPAYYLATETNHYRWS